MHTVLFWNSFPLETGTNQLIHSGPVTSFKCCTDNKEMAVTSFAIGHWIRPESVKAQNSSIIHTVYRGWSPMHEAHSGPEITYGFICIRCFCLLRNATLKLMKFLQKISGRLWPAPSHSSNRFEPRSHYLPHASPTLRLQTGAFPLRLTVIVASSIATAIKSLHISRYDYASTHHDSKGHFWHNGPSPQRTGWWWYWLSDL